MHAVKPSPRIRHFSPVQEKKLGFPFSENGPSAIQGEGATLAFSDLREWEERDVTTPNATTSYSTIQINEQMLNRLFGHYKHK